MKNNKPEPAQKAPAQREQKPAKKPYRKPALKRLGLLRSAGSDLHF